MKDISKQDTAILQKLAKQIRDMHVNECLDKLFSDFQRWKSGEISSDEIANILHDSEKDLNKNIIKAYDGLSPLAIVDYGIKDRPVSLEGLSEEVQTFIKRHNS